MSDMSFKEYTETVAGKTIDDVITEVKKLGLYEKYKTSLNNRDRNSMAILGSLIFLETLGNEKFDALTHRVAYDLMFSIMDQKLRAEILESEE